MKKNPSSGIGSLAIAAGLIAAGIAAPLALQDSGTTDAPAEVINLSAGEHTISHEILCDGEHVTSIDTYVDGAYTGTVFNPPAPPTGFRIVE